MSTHSPEAQAAEKDAFAKIKCEGDSHHDLRIARSTARIIRIVYPDFDAVDTLQLRYRCDEPACEAKGQILFRTLAVSEANNLKGDGWLEQVIKFGPEKLTPRSMDESYEDSLIDLWELGGSVAEYDDVVIMEEAVQLVRAAEVTSELLAQLPPPTDRPRY